MSETPLRPEDDYFGSDVTDEIDENGYAHVDLETKTEIKEAIDDEIAKYSGQIDRLQEDVRRFGTPTQQQDFRRRRAELLAQREDLENQTRVYSVDPSSPFADDYLTEEESDNILSALQGFSNNVQDLGANIGPTVINLKKPNFEEIQRNGLNDYHQVQYHMALSMLPQWEVLQYQKNGVSSINYDLDDLTSPIRKSGAVTLASTGDIAHTEKGEFYTEYYEDIQQDGTVEEGNRIEIRDIPEYSYYNIDSLSLTNIMSPSPNNPLISNMIEMKMTIKEPHGLSLKEDIIQIANTLDYEDINPGQIVYRVDIWFSGRDRNTGEAVDRIPLDTRSDTKTDHISYFVKITNIEADVEVEGTTYDLSLAPEGHFAYRPEECVFDAASLSTLAVGQRQNFGTFLDALETSLETRKTNRTNSIVKRRYKFTAPQFLRTMDFSTGEFANRMANGMVSGTHSSSNARDMDLMTILNNALADVKGVQDLLIANINGSNDAFLIPRIFFSLRFETVYGDANGNVTIDPDLYDYNDVTYHYIIEPYITFKKGSVTNRINNTSGQYSYDMYVDPENQIKRIKEIMRYGMLTRIYNYMYTSENTEVTNVPVNLKNFYYEPLPLYPQYFNNAGALTVQTPSEIRRKNLELEGYVRLVVPDDVSVEDQTIENLFGRRVEVGSNFKNAFQVMGGGFNETRKSDPVGSTSSAGDLRRSLYQQYMDDHTKNDLLLLEGMEVRGDPVWLLSPYSTVNLDGYDSVTLTNDSNRVVARTGKVIFLKILTPSQKDYMSPTRGASTRRGNIIGGFYEVIKVENDFSGGLFTQRIHAAKMNHLNYVQEQFNNVGDAPSPRSS